MRLDPDILSKLQQLGREFDPLLLMDILESEADPGITSSLPVNMVQVVSTISRDELVQKLADRIRHAYVSLKELTEELEKEGYDKLAEELKEFKFAKVPHMRSGDLGEIIATDLLRKAGYIVPIERLRFKEDNDRPVPNCDIIGFHFDTSNTTHDVLCVGEAKSQATEGKKDKNIYEEGMESLKTRDQLKRDKAVYFIYTKVRDTIDPELALYFKRFRATFVDDEFQLKAKAVGLQDVNFWDPELVKNLDIPPDFHETAIDAVLVDDLNQLIKDAFERAIEDIRHGRI